MPAAPIIVAAAVGSGAAAALGAAVVGTITAATISTAVATAVGVGIISGVSTAVQGGSSSDILRSAVIGGTASYIGGQVASKVTSSVAQQTGASLVDIEPALRGLSGEGASAAGVASITAGNVAGAAASAAITGQPIEQAALFGFAQSIPTALTSSQDFRSLNPVVQNVLASSAQAAVMGQDVGDAAIASLVASSGIVARAIKEVPGGEQFIQQNPVYAKYVIDSVSSALTAQLQGKDVSESVLYSLARTTADVLSDKFQDSQASKEVTDAQAAYNEAQQLEQQTLAAQNKLNEYVQQNQTDVNNYNYYKDRYKLVYTDRYARYDRDADGYAQRAEQIRTDPFWANYNAQFGYSAEYFDQIAANLRAERDKYIPDVNDAVAGLNSSYEKLQNKGFFDTYNQLQSEFDTLNRQLTAKAKELQNFSTSLTQNSANLFTDFETELATTLAPLTAFEETDVTDQDLLAEISPVAPFSPEIGVEVAGPVSPDILGRLESMPLFGEAVVSEQFIDNPDPEIGGRLIRRIQGFRNDGTPYSYDIATFEDGTVVYSTVIDGEVQILDARPDLKNSAPGVGDVQEGAAGGVGTGTPGAPAVDLSAQAPAQVVDPAYTVGFDLRDYGPGSPLSPNLAVFEIGGGRGTPGGSSTDTTFNLISRDTVTGQETYDVGGKQYSLIVLPDKQVLVPTEPSEVIVYLERDPVTDRPKMKEVPVTQVPQQDAVQIAAKVEETAGGAPTGAEGAAGGLTAERPSTTTPTEQLQPGVRPEEVAPGVSAEAPAPSFPDLISGITEPTMPAPVPGADAGFEDALQAPGAGGVGDEITDEDIIRIIQGEMGEAGGGEGEGLPGEEGAGPGEGEEDAGPGAGEEGEGEGAGGEGEGTGEGVGPGTGEGGTPETQLPQPSPDIVPVITTVGRRTFARPAEGAPYRVTGMDESGILGRKQPLFGGDEDLQRAEWNRRSLRLRRLLGL
jgi:hypothetical protein